MSLKSQLLLKMFTASNNKKRHADVRANQTPGPWMLTVIKRDYDDGSTIFQEIEWALYGGQSTTSLLPLVGPLTAIDSWQLFTNRFCQWQLLLLLQRAHVCNANTSQEFRILKSPAITICCLQTYPYAGATSKCGHRSFPFRHSYTYDTRLSSRWQLFVHKDRSGAAYCCRIVCSAEMLK